MKRSRVFLLVLLLAGNLCAHSVSVLLVGGGASGGKGSPGVAHAGGGGAGCYMEGTDTMANGSYAVVIGAGGLGVTSGTTGNPGGSSTFNGHTATGGGGGGAPGNNGAPGGSGGGAGGGTTGSTNGGGNTGYCPESSLTVYGNFGGNRNIGTAPGGGGGGAGAQGLADTGGGTGGAGRASSITGSSVTYAAGGTTGSTSAGAANTGDGGGGNADASPSPAGGSGVLVVSCVTSLTGCSGGNSTYTSGSNTINIFTSSGTLVVAAPGAPASRRRIVLGK